MSYCTVCYNGTDQFDASRITGDRCPACGTPNPEVFAKAFDQFIPKSPRPAFSQRGEQPARPAPWATGEFTQEFAVYNMLMAWTPEQCREFYAMLSRRPDFNPVAKEEDGEYVTLPGLRDSFRVRADGRIEGASGWTRIATDEEAAMYRALRAVASESPAASERGHREATTDRPSFEAGYNAGYNDAADRADISSGYREMDFERAWLLHNKSQDGAAPQRKEEGGNRG